jgi:hypothetical protein
MNSGEDSNDSQSAMPTSDLEFTQRLAKGILEGQAMSENLRKERDEARRERAQLSVDRLELSREVCRLSAQYETSKRTLVRTQRELEREKSKTSRLSKRNMYKTRRIAELKAELGAKIAALVAVQEENDKRKEIIVKLKEELTMIYDRNLKWCKDSEVASKNNLENYERSAVFYRKRKAFINGEEFDVGPGTKRRRSNQAEEEHGSESEHENAEEGPSSPPSEMDHTSPPSSCSTSITTESAKGKEPVPEGNEGEEDDGDEECSTDLLDDSASDNSSPPEEEEEEEEEEGTEATEENDEPSSPVPRRSKGKPPVTKLVYLKHDVARLLNRFVQDGKRPFPVPTFTRSDIIDYRKIHSLARHRVGKDKTEFIKVVRTQLPGYRHADEAMAVITSTLRDIRMRACSSRELAHPFDFSLIH